MSFVAARPSNGELLHAIEIGKDAPAQVDGHVIGRAACGLRRGTGFILTGEQFEDVLDRPHCARCVRAIALSKATTDDERSAVEIAYRTGTLRIAS